MQSTFKQTLRELGLNSNQVAVYLALLELGPSTVKPIADRAKLKRTSIYNFIDSLIDLGIVRRSRRAGRTYYAAEHPQELLELQKRRLASLEQILPALSQRFTQSPGKPRIDYFEGGEQVRNIVLEETKCSHEALYLWSGRDFMDVVGAAFMNAVDKERIRRGVRIRCVRQRHKDAPFATSAHGAKFMREIRYAPDSAEFKMTVGIYDTNNVGFISSAREGVGILVESAELNQLMRCLFEAFWRQSLPAKEGQG